MHPREVLYCGGRWPYLETASTIACTVDSASGSFSRNQAFIQRCGKRVTIRKCNTTLT